MYNPAQIARHLALKGDSLYVGNCHEAKIQRFDGKTPVLGRILLPYPYTRCFPEKYSRNVLPDRTYLR